MLTSHCASRASNFLQVTRRWCLTREYSQARSPPLHNSYPPHSAAAKPLGGHLGVFKDNTQSSANFQQQPYDSRKAAPQGNRPMPAKAPPQQQRQNANTAPLPPRRFADYRIYKGKGVLCVMPRMPTWQERAGDWVIEREGKIQLEFAPSVPNQTRVYDWSKKQIFHLSVTELGEIMTSAERGLDLFHDPGMKSNTQGFVTKTLSVSPTADKKGYFFTIQSTKRGDDVSKERIFVQVSHAEFAVMKSIFNYSIPYLLGFNEIVQAG